MEIYQMVVIQQVLIIIQRIKNTGDLLMKKDMSVIWEILKQMSTEMVT